jgi:hypothetical protein
MNSFIPGFGIPMRLLETDRPWRHPWLSVAVAEREIAQQDYEADTVQVFIESVEDAA